MYKLHYDVDAGKQVNVVYKGMEIEVQAGEGSGGGESYPIDNPCWISNHSVMYADVSSNSTYLALQDSTCILSYDEHYSLSFFGDVTIRRLNDNTILQVIIPVLPVPEPLYLDIDCNEAYFDGGDQSEYPIMYCKVKGDAIISGELTIGSNSSYHAHYEFYGVFEIDDNLTLNGCDLYLYSDEILTGHVYRILDGTNGGTVHVLTDYPDDTVGGHAVIKDLTPPNQTN